VGQYHTRLIHTASWSRGQFELSAAAQSCHRMSTSSSPPLTDQPDDALLGEPTQGR
jgi:hypothetical protein